MGTAKKGRPPLKKRITALGEHGLVVLFSIGFSFLIAVVAVLGIYALNYLVQHLFGVQPMLIQLVLDYSGIEAVVIFTIASVSLIRYLVTEEIDGGEEDERS